MNEKKGERKKKGKKVRCHRFGCGGGGGDGGEEGAGAGVEAGEHWRMVK